MKRWLAAGFFAGALLAGGVTLLLSHRYSVIHTDAGLFRVNHMTGQVWHYKTNGWQSL